MNPSADGSLRPFTDAQLRVIEAFRAEGLADFDGLLDKAREARNSTVALPHTNERGDLVTHGCNVRLLRVAETYYDAACALAAGFTGETRLAAIAHAAERGFIIGAGVHKRT